MNASCMPHTHMLHCTFIFSLPSFSILHTSFSLGFHCMTYWPSGYPQRPGAARLPPHSHVLLLYAAVFGLSTSWTSRCLAHTLLAPEVSRLKPRGKRRTCQLVARLCHAFIIIHLIRPHPKQSEALAPPEPSAPSLMDSQPTTKLLAHFGGLVRGSSIPHAGIQGLKDAGPISPGILTKKRFFRLIAHTSPGSLNPEAPTPRPKNKKIHSCG